jgi:hypothetical protein
MMVVSNKIAKTGASKIVHHKQLFILWLLGTWVRDLIPESDIKYSLRIYVMIKKTFISGPGLDRVVMSSFLKIPNIRHKVFFTSCTVSNHIICVNQVLHQFFWSYHFQNSIRNKLQSKASKLQFLYNKVLSYEFTVFHQTQLTIIDTND